MTQLPDKLSDLTRVALADLRKCEADPNREGFHTAFAALADALEAAGY